MNFMKKDEFLLLMVHCEGRAKEWQLPGGRQHILSVEERARLREVGIQTAHEQPAWNLIEPSKGVYDFDYLENIITRNRDAGLKSLIQISGWNLPEWMPNEWRARRDDGTYEDEMLSLWNEEAQEYSDHYYQLMIDNFPTDDVAFFFGEFQGGEGALPSTWCIYDDFALEEFHSKFGSEARPVPDAPETLEWMGNKIIEHYVRKSKILYPSYKEVWNEQQYLMDRWTKASGNYVQPDIMKKQREMFPDACIVLLQYTYFDSSHDERDVNWVDNLVDVSQCEVLVEAMFCKGLPETTPKAIAKGFRGQVVMPANEPSHTSLDDGMINAIRDSHNLWMESRE